jgi:hypothetical protein
MHMMFVDESGDPGYPANDDWKSWGGSRLYVRIGLVIHGWKWKAWNDRLTKLKGSLGLTWDAELKASDIRSGKRSFAGWEKARRQFFLNQVLDLVGGTPDITLLSVLIDKTRVDVSQRGRITRPEIRSMEFLLERYNYFLQSQQDMSGIVVLDPTEAASDDNVRYFQSYLQARSPHLQPLKIVEGTFFAKSHTSNMIQIADICCNVLYRQEARPERNRAEFAKIRPRFWRRNNTTRGYGIKRWPK